MQIIDYEGNDNSKIKELVDLFIGHYRVTQNASRVLVRILKKHPEKINRHLSVLLKASQNPTLHPSVRRNVLRLLQFAELPQNLQGVVAAACFEWLTNRAEPTAIRLYSMSALARIARDWPELSRELRQTIDKILPYASPAFILRA